MGLPVRKLTLPADLAGCRNGDLPDHMLVAPGWPLRPNARMHRLAAAAFAALAAEVKERFGETLTAVSTHDAYRHIGVQESTFRARYSPTPIPGRPTKTWNGKTYWQKPGTAMAGVPGTSNHGWSLAMDAALVRDGKVVGILANRQMFDWMLEHAHEFGISWETQSEPWHLRYNSGDDLPARCRSSSPATEPAPAPPQTTPEDDMTICVFTSQSEPREFNAMFFAECDAQGRSIELQWSGNGDDPAVQARVQVMLDNFGPARPLTLAGIRNNRLHPKHRPSDLVDSLHVWTDADFAP